MLKNPKLSIIILNHNTKELLRDCIDSLKKVKSEASLELVVVDNGSTDGSLEFIQKLKKENANLRFVINNKNLGFAAGNNVAKPYVKGEYILFLNTDTLIPKGTIGESIRYMDKYKDVGAMTCKMLLGNGEFDKDTRRSFMTPWVGFTHLFLRMDGLFPKSKLFGRYWYGYIPDTQEHDVDVIEGAYFFVRKAVLDKVGWFDESYFLDGENIDLCWRIKKAGWKIKYYPDVSITHLKGATKGKVNSSRMRKVPLKDRLKFRMAGVNSMEIFYRRWLWAKYPFLINLLVITGIKTIKILRFTRTVILG